MRRWAGGILPPYNIAMIIAEDRPTIRAINPTTWIKSTNYPEMEFAPSLRAFAKHRAELLVLLRPLPKVAWSRARRLGAPEGHANGPRWTTRGRVETLSIPAHSLDIPRL
jgi:hypothetical protein